MTAPDPFTFFTAKKLPKVFRLNVKRAGFNISKYRGSTHVVHRPRCGEEGEAGHNHPVAGADLEGAQGEEQRIRPIGHAAGVTDAQILGYLLLKGSHLGAEDKPTRLHHPSKGGVNVGPNGPDSCGLNQR